MYIESIETFINVCMIAVTALYAAISAAYFMQASYPQSLMLICYSIANVGILWSAFR